MLKSWYKLIMINSLTFSWNKSNTQNKGLNEFLGHICPKFYPKMFIQLFFKCHGIKCPEHFSIFFLTNE